MIFELVCRGRACWQSCRVKIKVVHRWCGHGGRVSDWACLFADRLTTYLIWFGYLCFREVRGPDSIFTAELIFSHLHPIVECCRSPPGSGQQGVAPSSGQLAEPAVSRFRGFICSIQLCTLHWRCSVPLPPGVLNLTRKYPYQLPFAASLSSW